MSGKTKCSVCRHSDRDAIHQAKSAGVSDREISRRFNVHRASLGRHFRSHVRVHQSEDAGARQLRRVKQQKVEKNLDAALEEAVKLRQLAEQNMDTQLLIQAQREIRRIIELQDASANRREPAASVPVTARQSWQEKIRSRGYGFRVAHVGFNSGVDPYSIDRGSWDVQPLADSTPEEIKNCHVLLKVVWVKRPKRRFESAEEKQERLVCEALEQYAEIATEPDSLRQLIEDMTSEEETKN